jgi:hypothetical protein
MRLLGSSGGGSWRAGAEWALRALVLALLSWYLVQVLRARTGGAAEVGGSAELPKLLERWSTVANPARVHVALDYPPPLHERDWLAALPGVGTAVSWSGAALVPTAVAMEPVADPVGGADLAVATPKGARVVLRDVLGPIDSLPAGARGVRVYLPKPPEAIQVAVGPVVARATLRDSLTLGRLLLLAHAGWEAKFTQAALEERGWKIDAFLAFSPKGMGDVRQGKIGAIDTATYSAVLALDTVAARYGEQIARYVRSGGGLVLWAPAAQVRGLAALAPGVAGKVLPDEDKVPSDTAPRVALALAPLTNLHPDALVFEQRKDQTALAARRVGLGRVVETGYVNSWRWRMAGAGEHAPDAHREWLALLVANVAYTGRHPLAAPPADVAPLATLVDRLGPAMSAEAARSPATGLGRFIFALLVAALILEWASRRLRGAK